MNQLKPKRGGSPEAFTKYLLGGGEKGETRPEQRIQKVAHQAEPADTASIFNSNPTNAENILAAAQSAVVGMSSIIANGAEDSGNATSVTNNHDDAEKVDRNDSDTEDVLEILDIPTPQHDPTHFDCIKGMQREHSGIKSFPVKSRKKKQVPTSDPEDLRRLARPTPYLNFLEFKLEMNHRISRSQRWLRPWRS